MVKDMTSTLLTLSSPPPKRRPLSPTPSEPRPPPLLAIGPPLPPMSHSCTNDVIWKGLQTPFVIPGRGCVALRYTRLVAALARTAGRVLATLDRQTTPTLANAILLGSSHMDLRQPTLVLWRSPSREVPYVEL